MSILAGRQTRLVVQGITGRQGSFHASQMLQYGTTIVAGVTPGRGGSVIQERIPVFDTVEDAVRETGANASILFVPPVGLADGVVEAAEAGVSLAVCITEGVPSLDMVRVFHHLQGMDIRLIGPNCPGVISPQERCKVGIMPGDIHQPGPVGVVSRSGTLTYEAVSQLSAAGLGQSTCVGIGGDALTGTSFVDVLALLQRDPETQGVVLIGEIGGTQEQEAAQFIRDGGFTKPLVALVVGRSAPPGRRMGHAGAIISGASSRAEEKIRVLEEAGAVIAPSPADIGATALRVLGPGL